MFFKMLKNDLKAHKGLNIILFCFIVGASVISVVAANLMYTEIVGRPKTDKINNVANIVINTSIGMGKFEEKKQALYDWMNDSSMIEEGEKTVLACAGKMGIREVITAGKAEVLEKCRLQTPTMEVRRYMVPEWMEQL